MKRLSEVLRGARRIEFWIAAAAICALIVLTLGERGATDQGPSATEARMERVLSRIKGAGQVTVMLSEDGGVLSGAVVVASGASDVRVVLELQRALRTLTGLELGKIEIVESKG